MAALVVAAAPAGAWPVTYEQVVAERYPRPDEAAREELTRPAGRRPSRAADPADPAAQRREQLRRALQPARRRTTRGR